MFAWCRTSVSIETFKKTVHQCQTRQANDLHVPVARTRSEQRALCFNGVKNINMLLSHVKNASSFGQFRSKLNIELGYYGLLREFSKLGRSSEIPLFYIFVILIIIIIFSFLSCAAMKDLVLLYIHYIHMCMPIQQRHRSGNWGSTSN